MPPATDVRKPPPPPFNLKHFPHLNQALHQQREQISKVRDENKAQDDKLTVNYRKINDNREQIQKKEKEHVQIIGTNETNLADFGVKMANHGQAISALNGNMQYVGNKVKEQGKHIKVR